MKILFYLEPQIELCNPVFRLGAIKNQVAEIAKQCELNLNASLDIIVGDGVKLFESEFCDILKYANVHYIDSIAYLNISKNGLQLIEYMQNDTLQSEIKEKILKLIVDELPQSYQPDIVITWESSNKLLKEKYNDALFIDLMPGFISRAPYPELISIDFGGYFKDSILNKAASLNNYIPTDKEIALVRMLREQIVSDFFVGFNPFPRSKLDPEGKFDKLILVPLQVSGYFSFNSSSEYGNSLDFVMDVLNTVPKNIGVVVTQYVTPHTKDVIITDKVELYLKTKFSNFIFDKSFAEIDSVSQFLLSSVDAVATVSSSVGLQALLFAKPVFVFGHSHLSGFSSGNTRKQIESALLVEGESWVYDSTLAFILSRIQVLSFKKAISETWYSDLILQYYKKWQQGFRGLDLYFSFFDIFPDYEKRFSQSIRLDVAKNKVLKTIGNQKNRKELEQTNKTLSLIASGNIKVVSFDIFDTLLERPFGKPTDLFRLINNEVSHITEGAINNFPDIRINAEKMLRNELSENVISDCQEITLQQIYQQIAKNTDIAYETLKLVEQLEIEYEKKLLKPRYVGKQLYEYAKSLNKRVIIVSDMYLPLEAIKEILFINGYEGYEQIYLSSDIGLRKHEGDLFDYVIKNLAISDPSYVLHIGDNPYGDVKMPKERGIKTLFLPSSFTQLSKNKKYKSIYWDTRNQSFLGNSILAGLISNKFFSNVNSSFWEDTHFDGSPFNLGYSATGPMFFAFTKWLIEESIKNKVETLYFLARDGYVLKQIYDKLKPYYHEAPESKYLYASRRAARVCSINNISDILALSGTSFFNGTLANFLTDKFGLDTDQIDIQIIKRNGFSDFDEKITTKEQKELLGSLILELKSLILETAKTEREAYAQYLNQNGINSQRKNIAVVDIGYAGSMQKAISQLSGTADISGYYFMTFDSALPLYSQGYQMYSFTGNFVNPRRNKHPLLSNGLAYEVLFSNTEGSFIKVIDDNGQLHIVQTKNKEERIKHNFLTQMWSGCDCFVKDFLTSFGSELKNIQISSDDATAVLTEFFDSPGGRDCDIFEGVTFDDAFAGANLRFMIPPRRFNYLTDEELRKKTVWQKGTQVFFRRPDIKHLKNIEVDKADSLPVINTGNRFVDAIINRKIRLGKIKKDMLPNNLLAVMIGLLANSKKKKRYLKNPYSYHMQSNNVLVKRALVIY